MNKNFLIIGILLLIITIISTTIFENNKEYKIEPCIDSIGGSVVTPEILCEHEYPKYKFLGWIIYVSIIFSLFFLLLEFYQRLSKELREDD